MRFIVALAMLVGAMPNGVYAASTQPSTFCAANSDEACNAYRALKWLNTSGTRLEYGFKELTIVGGAYTLALVARAAVEPSAGLDFVFLVTRVGTIASSL